MELGGVTPFGLPQDLPLWVDSRVMACKKIILGGGNRSSKLLMPPCGLLKLPNVEVVGTRLSTKDRLTTNFSQAVVSISMKIDQCTRSRVL